MDRTTWIVAWRHARRLTGKLRSIHGEAGLLDMAEAELGRRLPLNDTCAALACWQGRRYGPAVASFAQARSKRLTRLGELCSDRWEREEREAALAASPIFTEVPHTPRDARKFMGA